MGIGGDIIVKKDIHKFFSAFGNPYTFSSNDFTNLHAGDLNITENLVETLLPSSGRFKQLLVRSYLNTRDAICTVNLRLNQAPTSPTIIASIPSTTVGQFESPIRSVEFVKNDRCAIFVPSSGTLGSTSIIWCVLIEFDD